MIRIMRNAMTLTVLTVGMPLFNMAQSSAGTSSDLTAHLDPPPAADKGKVQPASTEGGTADLKPTVEQKIDLLQKEIDDLKNQLSAAQASSTAEDAAKLKSAEKALAAGPAAAPGAEASAAAPGVSSSAAGQEAAAAAPAASPTPEIGAQTTTKGEPFPGDWTWLNSNGHAATAPWRQSTSLRSFVRMPITHWTTTTPRTTRWAVRQKHSVRMNGSLNR